jgi:peptidyl-prolyl cis-trans isomerase D
MITFMRQHRKTLQIGLLVVVAAFVASLFVVGASNVGDGGERDWVAKVNGESIPVERYQRRYQAYVDMYAQIYRERFTPSLAERMGLPRQVVNDLVQEAVVVQRARREGIDLSDEELNTQIHQVPAFLDGGRFSLKRYQEFLKRRGVTAASFETDVRRELTRIKVEQLVKQGVKVSDAEVDRHWALQHEGVRAAWALVELGPIVAGTTATDEELDKHLKEHAAEFRQPDRRKIQYVVVSPGDFKAAVGDADVEKYYSEHAQEFETPRQTRVSHVLVRVPETGGSEAEDKAKAKAADVIRRVKAGEPFAKLAKEVSEDPGSGQNGGDLGFVGAGELVPEFEKAAFALKRGEVTPEPVRTPFGYHAITVTDVREGGKKPLAQAAPQIRAKLATERADQAARKRAEEVRAALQAAGDFMSEAKKLGVSPVETRMARAAMGAGLPRTDSIEETVFGLAIGGISPAVKSPTGYMIVKVLEHIPAQVPPLAEIRDQVAAAVKRDKAEAVGRERAKQIATDAKNGDFTSVARKHGATVGETPRFSRAKPADKIPGDAMMAALQTVPGAIAEPVKTPQGFYVMKVTERTPADTAELAKERDKVSRELLLQKQNQAWESWVTAARTNVTVEVSPRLATVAGS